MTKDQSVCRDSLQGSVRNPLLSTSFFPTAAQLRRYGYEVAMLIEFTLANGLTASIAYVIAAVATQLVSSSYRSWRAVPRRCAET